MPTLRRRCCVPSCREFVTHGRCARHQREQERLQNDRRRERGGEAVRTRGLAKWKKVARAFLDANPLCQRCGERLAVSVHHKVPLAMGGAPFDSENLAAVCGPCHGKENAIERAALR